MTRLIVNIILMSLCLILTGCYLFSDREIESRVIQAVPLDMEIQVESISKGFNCVAATVSLLGDWDSSDFDNQANSSTASGLGDYWESDVSFSSYVDNIDESRVQNKLVGTIIFGRTCAEKLGFDRNLLYSTPVMVTRSMSGAEVIMFFDQSPITYGIYFLQGR